MKAMMFLLAGTVLCAGPAFADEGMWTFDNFPAAKVKAKYGVDITQAWLDHVRSNAVRLSTGCSASIVSGNALAGNCLRVATWREILWLREFSGCHCSRGTRQRKRKRQQQSRLHDPRWALRKADKRWFAPHNGLLGRVFSACSPEKVKRGAMQNIDIHQR